MKKTNQNLTLLSMIFAVSLVISNVVTAKTIDLGFSIFGADATIPGSACCYVITFLITNTIGEIWGKKEVNRTILTGFVCQCVAVSLILITQILPAADSNVQEAYDILLGQSWIFFIGSMIAYFASQYWNTYLFNKLHNMKFSCIKNIISTVTGQLIDTVLFIMVSFGFGFGWLFDNTMWATLAAMLIAQYCFKCILVLIDTPVFYLLTHKSK